MSTTQIWSTDTRSLAFSDIQPKPLAWLWQNYIPRGKLSLLAGDPGSGKTSLILDLAARLSRADRLPPFPPNPNPPTPSAPPQSSPAIASQGPSNELNQLNQLNESNTLSPSPYPLPPQPAATLLLSPEDNLADTLRPRLESLHADISLIHTLPAFHSLAQPVLVDGQEVSPISHLDWIVQQIPNLVLLVIDPITYYLGLTDRLAPVNPNTPSPRSILHKLARLAAVNNIAILLTTRLTKKVPDADPTSLRRALGSLAFAAAARTVNILLPNSDLVDTDHVLFAPLKNNLAELPPALSFFPADRLHWDPDPIFIPNPEKPYPRQQPKDESELGEAVKFLRAALADGPVRATSLQSQAEENLFSPGTLRRAKEFLDCDAKPVRGSWYWSLKGDNRRILSPMEEVEKQLRTFHTSEPDFSQIQKELELMAGKKKKHAAQVRKKLAQVRKTAKNRRKTPPRHPLNLHLIPRPPSQPPTPQPLNAR